MKRATRKFKTKHGTRNFTNIGTYSAKGQMKLQRKIAKDITGLKVRVTKSKKKGKTKWKVWALNP